MRTLTRPTQKKIATYITEEDYWQNYYAAEEAYEWNNGQLEIKPVSDYLTYLSFRWFSNLLDHFFHTHPIARTIGLEMGFRLALTHKTTIRKPDLGVILNNNPVTLDPLDRSFHGICDLCIEVLSDSKLSASKRDTQTKKAEYLAAGVPEYYIVHNDKRRCAFYYRNTDGIYAPIQLQNGLIHSVILPGFCFRPGDLILKPGLEAMMQDPVYRKFVFPDWQAETQARIAAEQQLVVKMQAQQQAEARAERLASQLLALGIDPDVH